jgi:hypothetical protein
MKKTAFVPKPDQLESRVVLSSMPKFIHGAAVLTSRSLNQTYAQIQKAFNQFANHGQNYRRLQTTLANDVSRIPWNRRDGLLAAVESEVSQMHLDIATNDATPVSNAAQRALQDVHDFVQGEIADGVIVMR